MKNVLLLLIFSTVTHLSFAQTPQGINFQAQARGSDGKLLENATVMAKFSIIETLPSATPVYVETHSTTTDNTGLFNLSIGNGTVTSGIFSSIQWAIQPMFLKVEIDNGDGTGFKTISTFQLATVPYAFYAGKSKEAETATNYNEIDPIFENSIASKITANDTIRWNASGSFDGDMQNQRIINLADPVDNLDAVNKAYVDALLSKISSIEFSLYENGVVTLEDCEGNTYPVVKIGNQIWMAENLKTTKFPDCTDIQLVNNNTTWDNLSISDAAYSWYNDDINNKDLYGAYYSWAAAMNGSDYSANNPSNVQGLCPNGWHIPSQLEVMELGMYLGGEGTPVTFDFSQGGGKLKEVGIVNWNSPNTGATNETGFTSRPTGGRANSGVFVLEGESSYFWTTTQYGSPDRIVSYSTHNNSISITRNSTPIDSGLPIRCLKD